MSILGSLTMTAMCHLVSHDWCPQCPTPPSLWPFSVVTAWCLPYAFTLHVFRRARVHWLVFVSLNTAVRSPQGMGPHNWRHTTRSWASCWMNWRVLRSSVAPQTLSSTSFLQWAQVALSSASALVGRRYPLMLKPCTPKRSADSWRVHRNFTIKY